MKNLFFFLLMAGMTTLISCAKDGETGPRGPAGLDGQDGTNGINGQDGINGTNGQDGQNGQNGTNGQNGNANVKSTTIMVEYSYWSSTNSLGQAYASLIVPIITEEVAFGGIVMVYSRAANSQWKAWPYTLSFVQYTESFSFSFAPNQLTLLDTANDGNPVKPIGDFRIVAVTSEGRVRNPDLDWTNYEEVKATFNLAD